MKTGPLLLAVVLLVWSDAVSGHKKSHEEKKKSGWIKKIGHTLGKKAFQKSKEALLKYLMKDKSLNNVQEKMFKKLSKAKNEEEMLAILKKIQNKKEKEDKSEKAVNPKSDKEDLLAKLLDALNKNGKEGKSEKAVSPNSDKEDASETSVDDVKKRKRYI